MRSNGSTLMNACRASQLNLPDVCREYPSRPRPGPQPTAPAQAGAHCWSCLQVQREKQEQEDIARAITNSLADAQPAPGATAVQVRARRGQLARRAWWAPLTSPVVPDRPADCLSRHTGQYKLRGRRQWLCGHPHTVGKHDQTLCLANPAPQGGLLGWAAARPALPCLCNLPRHPPAARCLTHSA